MLRWVGAEVGWGEGEGGGEGRAHSPSPLRRGGILEIRKMSKAAFISCNPIIRAGMNAGGGGERRTPFTFHG